MKIKETSIKLLLLIALLVLLIVILVVKFGVGTQIMHIMHQNNVDVQQNRTRAQHAWQHKVAASNKTHHTATQAENSEPHQSWTSQLAAYPEGVISARAPLIIRFTHPVVAQNKVGKPVVSVARLEPEVPVKMSFTARNTLTIRPVKAFPASQTLALTLYPQALAGVDKSLQPFTTHLSVMRQTLQVRVNALAPAGHTRMMLTGQVETGDIADPKAVEQVVTATQNGQPLKIVWQHGVMGHEHSFTVTGIRRSEHSTPVAIRWNGTPLGVHTHGGHTYPVPASTKAFVVTMVRAVSKPKPHVRVQFSQPLKGDQNLAGLVTLDGQTAKTRIDGSALDVYPQGKIKHGKVTLAIHPGIRSATRIRMEGSLKRIVTLVVTKPGVRFVGKGNILPAGKTLSVPIEVVGAKAVKVQAFEVFANNVASYLQYHNLNSANHDRDYGRWLWQKTISLPPATGQGWQRYQLDLTSLMAKHPHGLILLRLKLDASTSTYKCPGEKPVYQATLPANYDGPGLNNNVDDYYRDAGYIKWSKRHDPCSNAYYSYSDRVEADRAFLASNLGLLAKQGENNTLLVFASWLAHNKPAEDVSVTAYNYQNQPVGKGETDDDGEVSLHLSSVPYYLIATNGTDPDSQKGYLMLARNLALPTNQFDTGGLKVHNGLKGYFYGERDVWRPGDKIHLTFVLDDPQHHLPAHYPLTLDWVNPRGDKVASYTDSQPINGFYAFTLSTDEKAPTGNWLAVVRVGNRAFTKKLRVEAIKPNHLKIDIKAPKNLKADSDNAITLHSQWLNGAIASNLKADVKVRLRSRSASFKGYDGFDFNDVTRKLGAKPFTAFEGTLDAKGIAHFKLHIPAITPPGMAKAILTMRVFEHSGDYSTQIRSVNVMPYQHWVGMHIPKGSGWGDALAHDKDNEIDFLTLNSQGQPEANRRLTLSVYRIHWYWWWDRGDDDLTNFINDPDTQREKKVALVTDAKGRTHWTLHGPDYHWGRYLLRVCQDKGRQCAAKVVYLGWGGARGAGGDAATRLALSSDKTHYQVGETAHVKVPVAGGGRLLVSLENGTHVLKHYWVDVPKDKDSLRLDIPVTSAMAPNVYVDITLLQAQAKRNNDRPIRLYGIIPLLVKDPATWLHPEIQVPHQVRPQHNLPVTVSEKDGKPMTYTLAVVDEGLLGLTNFHTPYIHNAFYRREALGVRTWDLYDEVVGAYGGDLSRLLAIGGSDAGKAGHAKKSRRFPPVVRFMGPFTLKAGETQTHNVKLPAYMGQVRVMVVAGNNHAFGSADQDVTVTQPLTLLATLPRVLGPGETLDLPVTVFAAPDKNGVVPQKVKITANAQSPLKLIKGTTSLSFKQAGNQIGMLSLEVGKATGMADVTVHASSGQFKTAATIHMPIRASNPATTREQVHGLDKGDIWDVSVKPHGMKGTNQTWLTVSRLPYMGLQKRLDYLIHYPHGCIEQTTSSVFPQLYLGRLIALTIDQKQKIQKNITAAINRLKRFQLPGGGFSYWPSGSRPSQWGTNYAGHFLVEAKRAGYAVPSYMLDAWKAYQKREARDLGSHPWEWSTQAYRLYTLALAGAPEVGAMNRLRELLLNEAKNEQKDPYASYLNARWLLAAAYQKMGLPQTAGALIPNQIAADYHDYWYYTFGSRLRDQAIAMQVRFMRGNSKGAWRLARRIAKHLASSNWYSTQSLSWALMAMAKVGGSDDKAKGVTFSWRQGKEDWRVIHNQAAIYRFKLKAPDQVHSLHFRDNNNRHLFVAITSRGTPLPGHEKAVAKGLSLKVKFVNLGGQPIDPANIKQGTDFKAIITVTNTSHEWLQHVALTQIMPSGWQITESPREGDSQKAPLHYRDVRDDRVLTYFSLGYRKSHTYTVTLNASFAGRFYLPSWQAEAMYKGDIHGRSTGEWVEVIRD